MLILALIYSTLLLIVANIVARRSSRLPFACVIVGVGTLPLGLLFTSVPILLQGLFVVTVGLICIRAKASPNVYLAGTFTATVISYAIVGSYAALELRNDGSLAKRYPLESMEERLAYERQPQLHPPFDADFLSSVESRLDGGKRYRSYLLQELHREYLTKFVSRPGFGYARLMHRSRPSEENLRFEETEPIALPPAPPEDWSPLNIEKGTVTPRVPVPNQPDLSTSLTLHTLSLVDFVNVSGFGYVKDKQHVAGFQSHGFGSLPKLDDNRWTLQHLELVSLLKFDEPAVYITEHLPRMDELVDAPTRPLDAFEATALRALRDGEDLIVDSTPNRIRMLGSIRAGKQCLECHTATRGQLLGAFSYRFRRQ
jgi:hypothetical protein